MSSPPVPSASNASSKPVSRILLSNDDGFDAMGIQLLAGIARQLSDDIWIAAPMDNKSGASRAITLRRDIMVETRGPQQFAVGGTPSDCVILGLEQLMDKKPDLVLSGINAGMNVADDVLYSGTIAAAMEATLQGVPAIALSQRNAGVEQSDFDVAAQYGEYVIRHLLDHGWPERTVMNVNFPSCDAAMVRGIKPASLDRHKVGDQIVAGSVPNSFRLGPVIANPETRAGSDRAVMDNGWIALTALGMDITSFDTQATLKTRVFDNTGL
ncbi:MAG: 5'/3'-nucleotidase SurE [SAR116 cluster bacterium]|nr:MAG: 5'/3'-nucleotidase SurE [SAR116 cluster bacterium]